MDWVHSTTIGSEKQTNVWKAKKQKGEGACERVRRGTIPLMSKDTSLHVQFMKKCKDRKNKKKSYVLL